MEDFQTSCITRSRIFTPYRQLGIVCNAVPLTTRDIRTADDTFICTAVANRFHTYSADRLHLYSVSDPLPHAITCLASDSHYVYAGDQNGRVRAFQRGRKSTHCYGGVEGSAIRFIVPFGDHIVAIDCAGRLFMWERERPDALFTRLEFGSTIRIRSVLHPAAYTNKLLLGFDDGSMQLWNLKTSKMLYRFEQFVGASSAVTCLAQSSVVDVVAVGLQDGRVVVHNLKFDRAIREMRFADRAVTALAFRLQEDAPHLIAGSDAGDLAVWHLETGRLLVELVGAHRAPISGLACFTGEPLFVTSSGDNSLRIWLLEATGQLLTCRVLRQRDGHSQPVRRVRFYTADEDGRDDGAGNFLLSAGSDSTLRAFSIENDALNCSLGRALFRRKQAKRQQGADDEQLLMPPIVDFAFEATRERDWDNIIAIHDRLALASKWSYRRRKMSDVRLKKSDHEARKLSTLPELAKRRATAVAMSACGNFCFIGFSVGGVDKFNMQSNKYRGSIRRQEGGGSAHDGAVVGIASDQLSTMLYTCGADARLRFWRQRSLDMCDEMALDQTPTHMILERSNGLLALALDDFSLELVDVATRRRVRRFADAHQAPISDFAFSAGSHWLVSASLDRTLKTWELASGTLLDRIVLPKACTSLTLTGSWLATTHVGQVGVCLWLNRSLYSPIEFLTAGHDPDREEAADESDPIPAAKARDQLADDLCTLSLEPEFKWQNLRLIDRIRERNRPKEAPRVPKHAPFFLPTVQDQSGSLKFDVEAGRKALGEGADKSAAAAATEGSRMQLAARLSVFQRALLGDESNSLTDAFAQLRALGSAGVAVEIRSLEFAGGGQRPDAIERFLDMTLHVVRSRKNFELANAYWSLFVKTYRERLMSTAADSAVFARKLGDIGDAMEAAWKSTSTALDEALAVAGYLRSALL